MTFFLAKQAERRRSEKYNEAAARILQQTLDEEGKTDKLLTDLAERLINVEAA